MVLRWPMPRTYSVNTELIFIHSQFQPDDIHDGWLMYRIHNDDYSDPQSDL